MTKQEENLVSVMKSVMTVLQPVGAFPCEAGLEARCHGDRMCAPCRVEQALLWLGGAIRSAEHSGR